MRILLLTTSAAGSVTGNRVAAERWARLFTALGHRATVASSYEPREVAADPELVIALEARRHADSIARFRHRHPERPVLVVLSGTELYGDVDTDPVARGVLDFATLLVAPLASGSAELPEKLRSKVRVVPQSAEPPAERPAPRDDRFEVVMVAHLRPVKDPFRAAEAVALLPPSSRVVVRHVGAAPSDDVEERALREGERSPRYRWLGERSHEEALALIARSRLALLTSRLEGGSSFLCEALACGVPVVASHVAGIAAVLGDDYPGYFAVGDSRGLAELLRRAESDAAFYEELRSRCLRLRSRVDPAREEEAWRGLLGELEAAGRGAC